MDKSGVTLILLVLTILIAGCFIAVHETKVSDINYNHGICSECGGEYRLTTSAHIKNSGDRFYYTCQECGHTVITYKVMR